MLHVHEYEMKADGITRQINRYCGAYVCLDCNDHEGLARCYCGWASDGGNGYQELIEMGENLDEDDYYYDDEQAYEDALAYDYEDEY